MSDEKKPITPHSHNKPTRPRKLLDQVRDKMRIKHYAISTERTYVHWIKPSMLCSFCTGMFWELNSRNPSMQSGHSRKTLCASFLEQIPGFAPSNKAGIHRTGPIRWQGT